MDIEQKRKRAAYMRDYYATHPEQAEKKREADRERYRKNRDKKLQQQKGYYEANKEDRKAYAREYGRNRRERLRAEAVSHLGGKCQECDVTDPDMLEFHHRDPSLKLCDIGVAATKPLDVFWAEVDKCDLLCANHHRKRERS